jgi:hypothetical protein
VLSLCEDGYAETRTYALQILPFIGRNERGIIETEIFVKSFSGELCQLLQHIIHVEVYKRF